MLPLVSPLLLLVKPFAISLFVVLQSHATTDDDDIDDDDNDGGGLFVVDNAVKPAPFDGDEED